jgi:hypothetical protein
MTDLPILTVLFEVLGIIFCGVVFVAAVCALGSRRPSDPATSEPGVQPNIPTHPHAIVVDQSVSWAQLPADSREVFFPPAPYPNPVYEVSFTGVLRSSNGHLADALYETNGDGNFSKHLRWIRVNGLALHHMAHEQVAADRFEHRYTFQFHHYNDERLTLALDHYAGGCTWYGALTVQVNVLPAGSLTRREQRAAELAAKQQEEADQARKLAAQREKTEAAERFAQQIQALCIRAEMFPNLGDSEYLVKFARTYGDVLVKHQDEIRKEAAELLEQHQIVAYLRRHHPIVIDRLLGRLRALELAEQFVLAKRLALEATPATTTPPQKKRLNAGEVRAIKVHKQQVEIGDRVALKLDKVKAKLKVREDLEKMPFSDDDERDAVEEELFREIDEGDDDENTKTL